MADPNWIAEQVTLGNIIVGLSMVANIGYQMRRLMGIEQDLAGLKRQQEKAAQQQREDKAELEAQLELAARSIEATYSRKDVLAETMQRISQSLTEIASQQLEIRTEIREMRQRGPA